jgi:hypothetical protein
MRSTNMPSPVGYAPGYASGGFVSPLKRVSQTHSIGAEYASALHLLSSGVEERHRRSGLVCFTAMPRGTWLIANCLISLAAPETPVASLPLAN